MHICCRDPRRIFRLKEVASVLKKDGKLFCAIEAF